MLRVETHSQHTQKNKQLSEFEHKLREKNK